MGPLWFPSLYIPIGKYQPLVKTAAVLSQLKECFISIFDDASVKTPLSGASDLWVQPKGSETIRQNRKMQKHLFINPPYQ